MSDIAINVGQRIVVEANHLMPITNLYDCEGEECGADEAITAVAGPDAGGRWLSIDLREFESVTEQ